MWIFRFIKDRENLSSSRTRQSYALVCSYLGIGLNLLLFGLKLLAGTFSHSITIIADGFNNLSDAGTTFVSMLGFQAAGRSADSHHPFGHGRIEWIMGMITSFAVMLMGIQLFLSSWRTAQSGQAVNVSLATACVLLSSILIKLYMAYYNKLAGNLIDSTTLQAVAKDCISDAVSTSAVLISALIGFYTGWQIDGWCGMAVSLLILYGGGQTFFETLEKIMGVVPHTETIEEIRELLCSDAVVTDCYDLQIHDYGFGAFYISAKIIGKQKDQEMLCACASMLSHKIFEKYHYPCTIQPELLAEETIDPDIISDMLRQKFEKISPHIKIHSQYFIQCGIEKIVVLELIIPVILQKRLKEMTDHLEIELKALDERYHLEVQIIVQSDRMNLQDHKQRKLFLHRKLL